MSYRGSFIRKSKIIKMLHKNGIPIVLHMHGSQFKDFYNESSDKKKERYCGCIKQGNRDISFRRAVERIL